jgi:predicted nucleotidyltransferase
MQSRSSSSSGVVFLDRKRALADVRRAVAGLGARREGVREVWLFGSLARGNATPRSDADLLIVVDRDARRPMDRVPEFASLLAEAGLGRPADLTVVTAAEWAKSAGTPFHRAVVTRGVRLVPAS